MSETTPARVAEQSAARGIKDIASHMSEAAETEGHLRVSSILVFTVFPVLVGRSKALGVLSAYGAGLTVFLPTAVTIAYLLDSVDTATLHVV